MQGSGYRTPEKTSYNAAGHLTETADNPLDVIKNDLLKALSYDGKGNGMSPQRASESTTTLFKIVSVGCTDMLTDEIVKTKDKVKNQLEELKKREESKQRDNRLEIDHYEHDDNASLTEAELEAIPLYKELGLLYKELEQIENIWKLRKANTTGGLVHMGAILRSGELRENKDLLLKSELLPIILSKDIASFSCLLTYFKTTITNHLIQEALMKKEFLSLEELKQGDDPLDNYDDENESFVQKTQKCRETIESFITANAEIIINLAIGITSNSTYKENIKHINLDDTQPISEYLKLIESDLFNKVIKLPLFNAAVEEAIKIQTITPPIAIPAPIIKLALQSITAEDLTKIKNLLESEDITTEQKIFTVIDVVSSNPGIQAALQNDQQRNQIADFATGQIIEKLNVDFNELGGKENLKAICHHCIVNLGPVIGSETNVFNVKAALSMLIRGIEGEAGINAFSKIILELFKDVPSLGKNQDLITKAGNLIGAIARDKVRTDAIDKEYIGAIATEFLTHNLPQITTPDIYAQTELALDNLFRKKYHDFIINVIAIARLNQGFRDAMTNDTNGITTATFKLLLPLLTQAGMPQEQHATYEKVTIAAMTHIGALLSDEDNQALIDLVNSSKSPIDKKKLAVNFINVIQAAPGLHAVLAGIANIETAIKTKLDAHINIPAPIIKLALQSITAEDLTKIKNLLESEDITTEQKIFTIIDVVSSNPGIQAALQDDQQRNEIADFATDQIIEKLNVNFDALGGEENLKAICYHCIVHLGPVIGSDTNVANVKAALSMLIGGIEGEAGVNAFSKIILKLFKDAPSLGQNQDLITKAGNLIGAIARDKVRTDAIDKEYIGAIATEFLTHNLPQITTPDIYAQTEQALDNLFRKKYHDFIINVIAIARLNQGFRDAITNDTNGITTSIFKLLLPLLTQAGMPQEQYATYEKVTIAAMTHIGALLSDEDNQALIDLVNSSKKDEHGSIDKKQLAVNLISLIQTAPGLHEVLVGIANIETAIKTKLDVHIDIPAPIIKLALQSITAEDLTKIKNLLEIEAITTEQIALTIINIASSNRGIKSEKIQIANFATGQIIAKLKANNYINANLGYLNEIIEDVLSQEQNLISEEGYINFHQLFKSLNIKSKEIADTLFNSPKNTYKDKITADIIAKIIETISADNSDKELTNKLINKLIKLYKATTQEIELHLLLKQLDDSEFELIKRLIPPKLTMKIIVCKISITRFLISEQDIAYSYKTMTKEGMDNIVADFLWQLAIKKLKSGIAALAFTYLTSALIYYFASLPYVTAIAWGNFLGMIVYLPLLAIEGTLYDYFQPEIKQIGLIENTLTPLLTLSALAIIFAPYFAINAAPYIVICCVLAYLLIINSSHKEEAKYIANDSHFDRMTSEQLEPHNYPTNKDNQNTQSGTRPEIKPNNIVAHI